MFAISLHRIKIWQYLQSFRLSLQPSSVWCNLQMALETNGNANRIPQAGPPLHWWSLLHLSLSPIPPTNSPLDNSPPGQFPSRSITPVGNSPLVNSHPGQFPPWSIAPWIIAPWTVAPRAFSPLGRFPSAPHTYAQKINSNENTN